MMPMKSAPGVSVEWYTDRCVSLVFSYWVWFRFFFGLSRCSEFDPLNISSYLPIKWMQEAEMYVVPALYRLSPYVGVGVSRAVPLSAPHPAEVEDMGIVLTFCYCSMRSCCGMPTHPF